MGCVITLAIVADGRLTIGHVGDTRLYKIRPDEHPQADARSLAGRRARGQRRAGGTRGDAPSAPPRSVPRRRHGVSRQGRAGVRRCHRGAARAGRRDPALLRRPQRHAAGGDDRAHRPPARGLARARRRSAGRGRERRRRARQHHGRLCREAARSPDGPVAPPRDADPDGGAQAPDHAGPMRSRPRPRRARRPAPAGRLRRTARAIYASRATWFVVGALLGVVGALALTAYVATTQVRAPQTLVVALDGSARTPASPPRSRPVIPATSSASNRASTGSRSICAAALTWSRACPAPSRSPVQRAPPCLRCH